MQIVQTTFGFVRNKFNAKSPIACAVITALQIVSPVVTHRRESSQWQFLSKWIEATDSSRSSPIDTKLRIQSEGSPSQTLQGLLFRCEAGAALQYLSYTSQTQTNGNEKEAKSHLDPYPCHPEPRATVLGRFFCLAD